VRGEKEERVILSVYVDDLLIVSKNLESVEVCEKPTQEGI
jgi:hypothetical protein